MHMRNAAWGGLAAAYRAASGLLISLLAVRLLGVDTYGYLATLLSLFVLYLSLNSSIFTALVVKVMAFSGDRESSSARAQSNAAGMIFCAGSILLLMLLTASLQAATNHIFEFRPSVGVSSLEIQYAVWLLGGLTAMQILIALQSAFIESAGRLDLAMKWQLCGTTIVLSVLLAVFLLGRHFAITQYVILLVIGALTDLTVLLFIRSRVCPKTNGAFCFSRKVFPHLFELLKSGGVLQATSLMNLFLEPLNKLLINHFVGVSAVAIYDLAMKVIWGIQSLFASAMRVFLHMGSQDFDSVGVNYSKVVSYIAIPVLLFHVVGVIFLYFVSNHWLSIDGVQLVVFFSLATFSNLAMIYISPLYMSLVGRGDFKFLFKTQLILAVTNTLFSAIFIPYFGLLGAAFGLLVATIYNTVAIYLRCGKIQGFSELLKTRIFSYLLSFIVFIFSVIWGVFLNGDVLFFVVISFFIFIITIREPSFAAFVDYFRFRRNGRNF